MCPCFPEAFLGQAKNEHALMLMLMLDLIDRQERRAWDCVVDFLETAFLNGVYWLSGVETRSGLLEKRSPPEDTH